MQIENLSADEQFLKCASIKQAEQPGRRSRRAVKIFSKLARTDTADRRRQRGDAQAHAGRTRELGRTDRRRRALELANQSLKDLKRISLLAAHLADEFVPVIRTAAEDARVIREGMDGSATSSIPCSSGGEWIAENPWRWLLSRRSFLPRHHQYLEAAAEAVAESLNPLASPQ